MQGKTLKRQREVGTRKLYQREKPARCCEVTLLEGRVEVCEAECLTHADQANPGGLV